MLKNILLLCLIALGATPLVAEEQKVSFTTTDNVKIAAIYSEPKTTKAKLPAVVFIHQGGSQKSEWTNSALFRALSGHQITALAYDVRGHGDSGGKADFSTLFNDPNQAPLDLEAALRFLKEKPNVDMKRIAIVGASIGSNLAALAISTDRYAIKTAVAMSGKTSAVYNLAGTNRSNLRFRSIFYIASENEQNGQRAAWAKELFDLTMAPKRLEIVKGSSGHGVSIFQDDPQLADRILTWLLDTL